MLQGAGDGPEGAVGDLLINLPPFAKTTFQKHFLKICRLLKTRRGKPHTGHQRFSHTGIPPPRSRSPGGNCRPSLCRQIPRPRLSSDPAELLEKIPIHTIKICLGGKHCQDAADFRAHSGNSKIILFCVEGTKSIQRPPHARRMNRCSRLKSREVAGSLHHSQSTGKVGMKKATAKWGLGWLCRRQVTLTTFLLRRNDSSSDANAEKVDRSSRCLSD